MKHKTPVATLVTAGLAVLLSACASPSPSQPKALGPTNPAGGHGHAAFMGSYDVNRDGVVTREEYDTLRKQRYVAADGNQDGSLSEAEYVAEFEVRLKQQYAAQSRQSDDGYAQMMKQAHVRFNILDKNKDGRLSVEEENDVAERTFKTGDVNLDGVVNAADNMKKDKN
jgi:Ca2+-binding EF-hand superfamily protein